MSPTNDKKSSGVTDLFKAIENAELMAVRELLENEINLEQTDDSGRTPLLLAVDLDNLEIAKVLLNAGADSSCFNEHLMENAIYRRKLDIVSFLIDAGFNVNLRFQENEDRTALMEAAKIGDINMVKKLVEHGADVNAVSRKNHFALMNAACQGWQEIYDYLAPLTSEKLRYWAKKELTSGLIYRKRKDDKLLSNFITASAIRDIEGVLAAIKDGVNINAFGEDETTALFIAANWGYLSIVRALIEAGVNVNLGKEDNRETPLMIAAARTALQKHKLDVDGSDYIEVIKLLIKAGANVNAKTDEVWTALMAAANSGSVEAVKLLLEAGANINHRDCNKDTALSRAKEAGHLNIVKLLREARARKG
ncbi:ankyrin repeat domain-containing protein [Argonema antarcticum]|uniref:ankyrin repeat domain-containing protein n=1 Tax=Argonema antarcticum TaxID=2942763 RepID=UPI002013572A|nr:ankyrin repeat domain-containing protein [Argonema antarcticum]MCL1474215.1 ankyrin repeat domain-containing protein [Argonema antarcticum A004/B2]